MRSRAMGTAALLLWACVLVGGCGSGDDGADGGADAADATAVVDHGFEQTPLLLDGPTCNGIHPGMPCSNGNLICTAPIDCEACGDGFILRAATCVCGAFWNCDTCQGPCGTCDAGVTYSDPACTQVLPMPDGGVDAGFDTGTDTSTGDAAQDAVDEAAESGEGG